MKARSHRPMLGRIRSRIRVMMWVWVFFWPIMRVKIVVSNPSSKIIEDGLTKVDVAGVR